MVLLSLILFFGLVGLFLKLFFTEEKIRKFASDIVSKSIPGGHLHLGNLKIGLDWNFKVLIEDLIISNQDDFSRENSLIFIKNLTFHLPLYSILDQTPDLNLSVSKVEFRSFEKPDGELSGKNEVPKTPIVAPVQSQKDESFFQRIKDGAQEYADGLLKNSSVNFYSEDFSFFRVYLERDPKEVKCQKINLWFESISHPLSLHLTCAGDTGETEPGLKGIITLDGEIKIKELLEKKNLSFSGTFKLDDPFWPPMGNLPTLHGKVNNLLINEEGIIVPFDVVVEKWGSGTLILDTRSGNTILNSINWNFNIEVLDFLLKKMPFSRKGQFSLKGKMSFLEKGFYPEVDLETKNLFVTFKGTKVPVSISGKIKGKNFNAITLIEAFKGSANSKIKGSINWNNLSNAFGPIKVDSIISSMELKIPTEKEKLNKEEKEFIYYIPEFPLNIKMKMEKVKLEKIVINGSGSFSGGGKKKTNLKMKLTLGNAPANIYAELLNPKKALLDFKLEDFDLSLLENIIPEKLGILKGKAHFVFNGTLPYPPSELSDMSFKIIFNAKDGDYNNPFLGENWENFIKENPGLEKYISKNAQPYVKFEKIILKGGIENRKMIIDQFLFLAPNNQLLINARGYCGINESEKSLVYLDIRDKIGVTISPMKNLFGMETLYFKLVGKGFKLKPDLVYTSSKILEKTATELPKNIWRPIDKILIDPWRESEKSKQKRKNPNN
jgi:hypothetical protein